MNKTALFCSTCSVHVLVLPLEPQSLDGPVGSDQLVLMQSVCSAVGAESFTLMSDQAGSETEASSTRHDTG